MFHLTAASLGAIVGLYEHSGYDFAVRLPQDKAQGLSGIVLRYLAPLITSKAHGEHHRVGNVSFSEGVGSLGICDTLFKTRWDLAAAKKSSAQRVNGPRKSRAVPAESFVRRHPCAAAARRPVTCCGTDR